MDLIAHALWAGAAGAALRRARPEVSRSMIGAMIGLAVAPDLVQMLPVVAASLREDAPLRFLYSHISALPGREPPMPDLARALSHHLHCIFHSIPVAAVATLILWRWRRQWLSALLGLWLHIALDIPTHSGDYYAVPVFYPFTYWGFDGVAWTNPWVLAANYLALAGVYTWLLLARRRR